MRQPHVDELGIVSRKQEDFWTQSLFKRLYGQNPGPYPTTSSCMDKPQFKTTKVAVTCSYSKSLCEETPVMCQKGATDSPNQSIHQAL